MKKSVFIVISLLLVLSMTACSANNEVIATQAQTESAAETIEETIAPETIVPTRDPDAVYEYATREIWCENNGNRIYGVAYIPLIDGQTRFPLVIHAHGMGSNHEAGAGYSKRYAEKGFAVYTFDFPGGSRPTNENKSDGDPMQNSAVTEASDLQAILDTALTWDFVDTSNVFLEGGSMGGLVATMVGLDNTDTVKGMILHYPALYMPQVITARYASPEDVPEVLSFGEDYELGAAFARDLWNVDVVSRLGDFIGNVTIIQGSDDQLVSASSIEEAAALFRSAEFHLIEGAGHGFSGDDFDIAVQYGLDFLFANT
ncbi:MAG: alpha/beta hydrolase [Ruminococcus sp.]|nr:alpha/beta hydrolase [Ruminococcus sp.]